MRHITLHTFAIAVVTAFLTTGCYTQVQTVHPDRIGSYYDSVEPADRDAAKREGQEAAVDKRLSVAGTADDSSYLYGYEDGVWDGYDDGWSDAERYYFLDYEVRDWYHRHGAYPSRSYSHVTYVYNDYAPWGWHPYDRFYHHYRPWRTGAHFYFGFGTSYHHPMDSWYGWGYDPYGYHYQRYPAYGYGGYYGYPYVHSGFYYSGYRSKREPERTYRVRSSGLSGTGVSRDQRTRSSASTVRTRRSDSTLQQNTAGTRVRGTTTGRTLQRSRTESGSRSRVTTRSRENNRAGESIKNRIETRSGESGVRRSPVRSVRSNRSAVRSRSSSGNTVNQSRRSSTDSSVRTPTRTRTRSSVNRSRSVNSSSQSSTPSRSSSRDRSDSSSGRSR